MIRLPWTRIEFLIMALSFPFSISVFFCVFCVFLYLWAGRAGEMGNGEWGGFWSRFQLCIYYVFTSVYTIFVSWFRRVAHEPIILSGPEDRFIRGSSYKPAQVEHVKNVTCLQGGGRELAISIPHVPPKSVARKLLLQRLPRRWSGRFRHHVPESQTCVVTSREALHVSRASGHSTRPLLKSLTGRRPAAVPSWVSVPVRQGLESG